MKKLVLCEFAGRRKKVVFETEPGKSDVSSLKKALVNAGETDKDLRDRMANSTLVFQHIDLELCSQPIDIEEGDIIEDKSIVTIVFTPVAFLDVPVIDLCGTTSKKEFLVTDIGDDWCDVNEDTTENISNPSVGTLNEASSKTNIATLQSSDVSEEIYKPQSAEVITETSEAKSSKVSIKKHSSTSIPLPMLPENLESCTKLLDHINELVRICATHLLSFTNGKPTSDDYTKFSMAMCSKYPILKDVGSPTYYGSFKKMVSNCIRNRRAFLKRKILSDGSGSASKALRTTIQMCVLSSLSVESSQSTPDPDMTKDIIDGYLDKLMSQLKEIKPCATNLQHMKMLMSKTTKMRRDWIVNKETDARCSTILKQFPYLKTSELLQHDFDLLGIWKSNAVQNLDILLEKLCKLFKMENATTEADKLSLLIKAEKALIANKALSSCKAITTRKIHESPDILKTEENESPRLVIFLDSSRISQAFIVADKDVELAVDNPTVASCIHSLMGMYYVCDIMYPKSYTNFFHLIDFEVIGIPKHKTLPTKFCTFLKKLNST